jgi:hypothetical protein
MRSVRLCGDAATGCGIRLAGERDDYIVCVGFSDCSAPAR